MASKTEGEHCNKEGYKSGSKGRDLYNIVLEICLNACIPALRPGESVTST